MGGGGVVSTMGAPRMRSVVSTAQAAGPDRPPARAKRQNRALMGHLLLGLHLADRHGAFLVISLQRDGAGGVERDLVDQLARVEPGHEDQTLGRLVAAARFHARTDRSPPRADLDDLASPYVERAGVLWVEVADGIG